MPGVRRTLAGSIARSRTGANGAGRRTDGAPSWRRTRRCALDATRSKDSHAHARTSERARSQGCPCRPVDAAAQLLSPFTGDGKAERRDCWRTICLGPQAQARFRYAGMRTCPPHLLPPSPLHAHPSLAFRGVRMLEGTHTPALMCVLATLALKRAQAHTAALVDARLHKPAHACTRKHARALRTAPLNAFVIQRALKRSRSARIAWHVTRSLHTPACNPALTYSPCIHCRRARRSSMRRRWPVNLGADVDRSWRRCGERRRTALRPKR
jgi:hypothetical protein